MLSTRRLFCPRLLVNSLSAALRPSLYSPNVNVTRLLHQKTSLNFVNNATKRLRFGGGFNRNYLLFAAGCGSLSFWLIYEHSDSLLFSTVQAKSLPGKSQNFLADVVEFVSPSVVHIQLDVKQQFFGGVLESHSGGAGILVRSDGIVVTNSHVVGGIPSHNQSPVKVKLSDGRTFSGRVIAVDHSADLAAVRLINASNLPIVEFADSSLVRAGEFVVAIGSPLLLPGTQSCSFGIISNACRQLSSEDANNYIQTDAAINVGNSGGPLVDLDGRVVGINRMKVAEGEGVSFAIPSNRVRSFVNAVLKRIDQNKDPSLSQSSSWFPSFMTNEHQKNPDLNNNNSSSIIQNNTNKAPDSGPHRKRLGLSYYVPETAIHGQLRVLYGTEQGLVVHAVNTHSPAALADIRSGDLITHINGKAIKDDTDLLRTLESNPAEVRFGVMRPGGQEPMQKVILLTIDN